MERCEKINNKNNYPLYWPINMIQHFTTFNPKPMQYNIYKRFTLFNYNYFFIGFISTHFRSYQDGACL